MDHLHNKKSLSHGLSHYFLLIVLTTIFSLSFTEVFGQTQMEIAEGDLGLHIQGSQTGIQIDTPYIGLHIDQAFLGVAITRSTNNAIYIDSAVNDGIYIARAHGNGMRIKNSAINGLLVENAELAGLRVVGAVSGATVDQVQDGYIVYDPERYGFFSDGALNSGMYIRNTRGNGSSILNSEGNGILIDVAGENGMFINETSQNGIKIQNSSENGVHVEKTGDSGLYIKKAGFHGIVVDSSDWNGMVINNSNMSGAVISNPNHSGLVVDETGEHGIYVLHAGQIGMVMNQPQSHGIVIDSAGADGIRIINPADDGINIEDVNDDGITISNSGHDGIHVNGSGGSAGIFIKSAVSDDPAVIISHDDDTKTDLKLIGEGRIENTDNMEIWIDSDDDQDFGAFIIRNSGGWGAMSVLENGDVDVVGNLSKGGGSFKIDHPIDPYNKYLYHSFVESPDMMNVYNGNVHLDKNGEALVEMADWFEALNRDYRYQLTPIGGPADLYIAQKIENGIFKIAGGNAGQEVSWQVTGIRQDTYANEHRIPIEEMKPANEKGTLLHRSTKEAN